MLELKLKKIVKVLLYLVPFLALIFIEGLYFPFVISRTVFFRLLMQFGLSLYLLLLALNFKKYKPRFNLAFILVGIFLIVHFVAAVFGLDFYKSFWSDFERMEGVISLIYLIIYLFLLQAFFKNKTDWIFYIRLILISSVLVSLYGLMQRFSILPVFEAGVGRATSTIGNAAFLAGYLLVAFGLGVYYYFNEARQNYKYFALAVTGLNLIVLLLTSTRGAILGLAVGILFFTLLNLIFLSGKARRNSAILIVILVLILGSLFTFRSRLADSNIELIRRLTTFNSQNASIRNRFLVWGMVLKDFKSHPILGVGMENFNIVFNKYYNPNISENWFDRTHNVYLDQLTSGGILGLTAYLAILFYLFYLLFKNRRDDYYKFAILLSLLVAYGIHNVFVFDTINTSFLYFFLIGLISFKEKDDEGDVENVASNNTLFNRAFIILFILNIFVFYKLVYLPLKINRAIYVGYYYVLADTFRSYENFNKALNYKLGSVEAAVQLNKMLDVLESEGSTNAEIIGNYYWLNRRKLEFASLNYPFDIKTRMYLGQLILNNYQDLAELDEAERVLSEAKKLSPSRVEPYYLLYNLYSKRNEKDKARAELEELVERLSWYGGAKIMLLGDIYKEDLTRAEELFQEGISEFGYTEFGGLTKIITYLLDQKRYVEVVPYYDKLIIAEPARYDYLLDLVQVYYLSGDIAKAVEQINVIKEKSPETLRGYEELINTVNQANGQNILVN